MTGCVEGFVFRCVSEKEKNEKKKDGRNKKVEKYKHNRVRNKLVAERCSDLDEQQEVKRKRKKVEQTQTRNDNTKAKGKMKGKGVRVQLRLM